MLRSLAVTAAVSAAVTLPAALAGATTAHPVMATYAGHTITINAGSWHGARACATDGLATTCYASEAAMQRALNQGSTTANPASSVRPASSSCSSALRLYEHGGFGGRVLYVTSRFLWLNLGNYSFNNITSSFAVGACTSYLAANSNGGGTWYPGGSAWQSVPVMPNSWNDRISSVYLT